MSQNLDYLVMFDFNLWNNLNTINSANKAIDAFRYKVQELVTSDLILKLWTFNTHCQNTSTFQGPH